MTPDTEDILSAIPCDNFRVSIFGSARIQPNNEVYQKTFLLAKSLGDADIGVVTGGGPGVMEAANKGHRASDFVHSKSIGLTVDLPFEPEENDSLDVRKHFHRFSNRLDHFMALSHAVVVMPGGIGTCLELFYTWQLTQVKHICRIPIILHGQMWHELLRWGRENIIEGSLAKEEDFTNVLCVKNNKEAIETLLSLQEDYEKVKNSGESFCINYRKYAPLTPAIS